MLCARRPSPGAGGAQRGQAASPGRCAARRPRHPCRRAAGRPGPTRRRCRAGRGAAAAAPQHRRAREQRRRAGARRLHGHRGRAAPGTHRTERGRVDGHAVRLPARHGEAGPRTGAQRGLHRRLPAGAHAGQLRRDQGLRAIADRGAGRGTAWQRRQHRRAVPRLHRHRHARPCRGAQRTPGAVAGPGGRPRRRCGGEGLPRLLQRRGRHGSGRTEPDRGPGLPHRAEVAAAAPHRGYWVAVCSEDHGPPGRCRVRAGQRRGPASVAGAVARRVHGA